MPRQAREALCPGLATSTGREAGKTVLQLFRAFLSHLLLRYINSVIFLLVTGIALRVAISIILGPAE